MSTATLERTGNDAGTGGGPFAGTSELARMFTLRDKTVLGLWTVYPAILPVFYALAMDHLYPTAEERARFISSTSAALKALEGPTFGASVGGLTAWFAGIVYPVIALAVILTVIRHTRAEEESGRFELVGSTSVGRYAGLTAALILAIGGVSVCGLFCFTGLVIVGLPAAGAAAFGVAVICAGAVFAGVAAVAAQLSTGARTARGIALGALGFAFMLRAVGDAGSGTVSWLSPLSWSQQIRPFSDERWWVVILSLSAVIGLITVAYALLRGRDAGAGVIAERPGPRVAPPSLAGPVGLAWRSHRGQLVAWTVGLGLFGLLVGGMAHGVGDQFGDIAAVNDIILKGGASQALEESFIAMTLSIFGIVASAYAVSEALQLHVEEESARAEAVLSTAVGRIRWAFSHVLFAIVGPTIAMVVTGLLAGLTYGIVIEDVSDAVPRVVAGALVQLPAVWLMAGLVVALFGVLPKYATAAWGVLAAFLGLYIAGVTADIPQVVLDLNPFSHLPILPGGEFRAVPVVGLTAIAVVLLGVGLVAFRRRDMR